MDNPLKLFDKVVLINDIDQNHLRKGMVGSIVEIYNNGEAFEVEFMDPTGHTYAVETIEAHHLLKLIYEPIKE